MWLTWVRLLTVPVLTTMLLSVLVLSVLVLSTMPVLLPVGALVPLRGQPAKALMAPTARTTST